MDAHTKYRFFSLAYDLKKAADSIRYFAGFNKEWLEKAKKLEIAAKNLESASKIIEEWEIKMIH